jgi:biotin transport system substrate-specific component
MTETSPALTARPSRFDARDLARIAIFAAIIAALGLFAPLDVPGLPPIIVQNLGIILAGAVLGAARGTAAVAVFILLVAIGLPLLSGGYGGIGPLVGPTSGYIYGWLACAFVTGLIAHSGRRGIVWWRVALGGVAGVLAVYLPGIPVYALASGLPIGPTAIGNLIFLPGDFAKVVVATLLTVALWKAYPPVFGRLRNRAVVVPAPAPDVASPAR